MISLYCYNNKIKQMAIDNVEMAQKILKLAQSQEKFDQIAKYGLSKFQTTKKDFDVFREKSNISHLSILLKKRMSESNHHHEESEARRQRTQSCWHIHEHKSYIWISVCFSYIIHRGRIAQLQEKQTFFNWVFCQKTQPFLRYNARSLLKEAKIDRQKWPSEEVDLLYEILGRPDSKLKWAKASIALFIQSNGLYYRSAQRCREKWYNRLNPSISHSKWTIEEDEILITYVYQIGKKWAQISKFFNGTRNQHTVKNRFNSLINKYKSTIKTKFNDKFLMALLKILRQQIAKAPKSKIQSTEEILVQTQQYILEQDISSLQIYETEIALRQSQPFQQEKTDEVSPQLLNIQAWWQLQSEKYLQSSQEPIDIPYFQKRLFLIDQSLANISARSFY